MHWLSKRQNRHFNRDGAENRAKKLNGIGTIVVAAVFYTQTRARRNIVLVWGCSQNERVMAHFVRVLTVRVYYKLV